jgi:pimeloyl-ACP methyl ester carboxylesterase
MSKAWGRGRMQDNGGPVGFRMVLEHPERVKALIVQNAVAHNEGLEADIQTTNQQAGPTYVCPGANCNASITDVDTPVTVAHDYKLD